MPVPNRPPSQNKYSEQYMENASFDEDLNVLARIGLGFDGQSLQRQSAGDLAGKVIESGGYTYIAKAAPGTTEATAKWKAYRYDSNGTKTYADGNSNFDNVATDLTALTYA